MAVNVEGKGDHIMDIELGAFYFLKKSEKEDCDMEKYCFNVRKIVQYENHVIVEADSLEEAEQLLKKKCKAEEISIFKAETFERFEYNISEYYSNEDGTFDDRLHTSYGMQVIKKDT